MFYKNGSEEYPETKPVIIHLNAAVPPLRLPFDIAGQYMIANSGYKEVHAAHSEEHVQSIVAELEEQSRRWIQTQPAAKIIPLF